MYVTICGRFRLDEGAVTGYGSRIRVKYTAKWDVQIADYSKKENAATSDSILPAFIQSSIILPEYIPVPSVSLRKEQHHQQHLLPCYGKVR